MPAASKSKAHREAAAPAPAVAQVAPAAKPKLPALDPLAAAQEEALHAKTGALRLGRAVDALRTGLETIVVAEMDMQTKLPVSAQQLRQLALEALDAYTQVSGQSWRRHKLIGSYAGDRDLTTLEISP